MAQTFRRLLRGSFAPALALLTTLMFVACDDDDDCSAPKCSNPADDGEMGDDDDDSPVACNPDARPADTSLECGAGDICRHYDDGQSLCTDFGAACEDHDECCEDCVCIAGGTCVETVFVDFNDVPCESDADCPTAASCITRNYGNKRCAYPG